MSNKDYNNYQLLYFTTPFCGVCQSGKQVMQMLAMSLEVPLVEEDIHGFVPSDPALVVSMAPSAALVFGTQLVYYTDNINNLSDLFDRFDVARTKFVADVKAVNEDNR